MKKLSFLFAGIITAFSLSAQQVPRDYAGNWDGTKPLDSGDFKYIVGLSLPEPTEQAAYAGAWRNALQNFASSIATRVESLTDITVTEQGRDSDIADAYTVLVETSSFSTRVPLTGVRELARKSERESGKYKLYILAVMSAADYQKAVHSVDNEEAAYRAYRFFAQKVSGIERIAGKSPAGYPDFYTWLRNTCVTISFNDDRNAVSYLEQTQMLCNKLYRNITIFPAIIDGVPARIMYDSPRYYGGIYRTLQNFGMFDVASESSILKLTAKRTSALNDFRSAVANMKDASKIFVTGIEVIQTENGSVLNTDSIVVNQFKTLVRQFNLSAVNFNLPPRYTGSTFLDEAAIIDYINKNSKDFPARFVALITAETKIEDPGYTKPYVIAAARFTIYDILTGEEYPGEARGWGGQSPLVNTQAQTVIATSRKALEFLSDKKNDTRLEVSMREVLERL